MIRGINLRLLVLVVQKVDQLVSLPFTTDQRYEAESSRSVLRIAITIAIRVMLISLDIPLSFNVGLNDHVELFFKTNG